MNQPSGFIDLSLFHRILVFVEDKGRAHLSDIDSFGNRRQTLGALGRLEGLRYIEREKQYHDSTFALTEKGDSVLADILAHLSDESPDWDGRWRIILFDVPETQRTLRQMLRLKLLDWGARMLQSSVWISPYDTAMERFRHLVHEYKLTPSVHFFTASHFGDNPIDVAALWNLPSLEQKYVSLFSSFESEYRKLEKTKNSSYIAKCLIVRLALTAKQDPRLPAHAMPPNWIGSKSSEWYKKLRVYCH
jgi:phenylacetic acid degradation operon negative regulatory protein